jgi:hypothetical protein
MVTVRGRTPAASGVVEAERELRGVARMSRL